jgi:hypothetical protein
VLKGSRVLQANRFGWSSCQRSRIEDLWRYCTGLFICWIYNVLWKSCLSSNDSSYRNWRVVKFRLRYYVWNEATLCVCMALIIINNCYFLWWTHWVIDYGPSNLFRWLDIRLSWLMIWYPTQGWHLPLQSIGVSNSFWCSEYGTYYLQDVKYTWRKWLLSLRYKWCYIFPLVDSFGIGRYQLHTYLINWAGFFSREYAHLANENIFIR